MTENEEFNPGKKLCLRCERKSICREPCPFLQEALSNEENFGFEKNLSPLLFQKAIAERKEFESWFTPEDQILWQNLLDKLPQQQRRIALLLFEGHAPTPRLARLLGISRRTLRTQVKRIQEALDADLKNIAASVEQWS